MIIFICLTFFIIFLFITFIIPQIEKFMVNQQDNDWKQSLKTLSSLPCFMFVSICSLLNFSFCLLVSVFILPIYTIISTEILYHFVRKKLLFWLQIILLGIFSPFFFIMIISWFLQCNILELLYLSIQQFSNYKNLTFFFFSFIFIPLNLSYFTLIIKE